MSPDIKVFKVEEKKKELIPCQDWFYRLEGGWTRILNQQEETITVFYRQLTYDDVYMFRLGWLEGQKAGVVIGQTIKAEEIRKKLNI